MKWITSTLTFTHPRTIVDRKDSHHGNSTPWRQWPLQQDTKPWHTGRTAQEWPEERNNEPNMLTQILIQLSIRGACQDKYHPWRPHLASHRYQRIWCQTTRDTLRSPVPMLWWIRNKWDPLWYIHEDQPCPDKSHRWLIRLGSGKFAGRVNTLSPLLRPLNHSWAVLAVCGGALSCWGGPLSSGPPLPWGSASQGASMWMPGPKVVAYCCIKALRGGKDCMSFQHINIKTMESLRNEYVRHVA